MIAASTTIGSRSLPEFLLRRAAGRTTPYHVPASGPHHQPRVDIAEAYPSVFFSIGRRTFLAKGSAHDLTHVNSPALAVEPLAVNVTEGNFQMGKRNLLAAQMLSEAKSWAVSLTNSEMQGPGDLEDAWRRIETRYGVPYGTMWSLRYRWEKLKTIDGPIYMLLRNAYTAQCESLLRRAAIQADISELTRSRDGA